MRTLALLITMIFAAPVFADQSGVQEDKGSEAINTTGENGTTGISGGSKNVGPEDMDKTVRGGKKNYKKHEKRGEDIKREHPPKDADATSAD